MRDDDGDDLPELTWSDVWPYVMALIAFVVLVAFVIATSACGGIQ